MTLVISSFKQGDCSIGQLLSHKKYAYVSQRGVFVDFVLFLTESAIIPLHSFKLLVLVLETLCFVRRRN